MYLTILIRPATTDNITTSAATTFCVTSYDPFYAIIIIVITGIYSEKNEDTNHYYCVSFLKEMIQIFFSAHSDETAL